MRLARQVAVLPGISHASAIVSQPFAGTSGVDATIFADGQPFAESVNPLVNYEAIDSTYFVTLGLPILRGRAIDERDHNRTEPAVVVNEAFARLFWPGKDPLGRRVSWDSTTSHPNWHTVVGLAADTRYRELTSVRPTVYVPYEQGIPVSPGYLLIRTQMPSTVADSVRQMVMTSEPGAAVVNVTPLPLLLAAPLARPRFISVLLACFAALSLVLSLVGIYGALSFFVRQRRRDIGIRVALGAAPWNVRRLVIQQGAMVAIPGVIIGVAGLLIFARVIQPLLFAVTAFEPLVLIAAAAVVMTATLAAMLFPARLAARTDVLRVLRDH